MEFAITFLEGVITFISPCLLPMLPIYVAYFAGDTSAGASGGGLRRTVVCAFGFILGFTVLFTSLGALAGTAGSLIAQHQTALNVICGAIVILLGLNYLEVFEIPALKRTLKPNVNIVPRGFASSFLFGVVFAVGWTPCVGAFLGSALSLAASTNQTAKGVALLVCYSLGLGLPFFISAILIDRLEAAFTWVKSHYRVINRICGGLLVLVGILMATGLIGTWLRLLSL